MKDPEAEPLLTEHNGHTANSGPLTPPQPQSPISNRIEACSYTNGTLGVSTISATPTDEPSPTVKLVSNASLSTVAFVICTKLFDLVWIWSLNFPRASRDRRNKGGSSDQDVPTPPLFLSVCYCLPILAWGIHYHLMTIDLKTVDKRISRWPKGAMSYVTFGFWILTVVTSVFELAHILEYLAHPSEVWDKACGGDSEAESRLCGMDPDEVDRIRLEWAVGFLPTFTTQLMLLPALIAFAGFINFFRFAPVQTKPAPETSPAEIDDLVVQTAGDDRNPPESVISPPTDPTAVLADDLSESGETGTLTPRSHAVGEDLLHEGGTTGYEDSGADEADLNASRRKSEKKAAAKKRTELEKRIKRAKKYGDNGTDVPKLEELAYPKSAKDFQRHFQRLLPFIWPEDRKLQFSITLCVGIMLLGRYVTWLVPRQYKEVINALGLNFSGSDVIGMLSFGTDWHLFASSVIRWVDGGQWKLLPWREILTFVFLSFLQGGVGLLDTVQNFLWIPVGQFTTRAISLKMFAHLHNLSLRFHINRKTGEILRVQDRGVASIVSILSSILFNIVPTLVDIVIAVVWFTVEFDLNFGYIVFCTMLLYLYFTIALTEWRTKHRRYANQLDNVVEAKAVDSLLNFETVKYYNAERFELDQYTTALSNYQKADFVSSVAVTLLNNVQNLIIQLGLLVGCILCAKRIVIEKTMSLGDFVLYIAYINQLYRPLNWFGSYYRVIQKNFVDMEKMLDLLKEPVEVKDAPNAPNLVVTRGEVVFENVSFSYDPRVKTLEDITFRVPQGSTVALVGPSGSGKSTVLRLLFRFYDTETGRILIDGQDIRHVTQESLREHIGVVPQDTVLFNDTIRYNILYGRPKADGAEIVAAAKAAQIHNRIKRFPDGYNTRVGERGLRLSGGEKQRVAIARTLLKNPAIVLLDEATSALDTQTERQIQHQLTKMTEGRTTLVIAHRLSTIVNAQLILVLANGKIIERGKHSELMTAGGVYFDMWMKQLRDHDGISEAGSR